MVAPNDTDLILSRIANGEVRAADELFPLIYNELHGIAGGYLRNERPNHTLQATALVHEAYIRMVNQEEASWEGQTHFKKVACFVIRRLLKEYARSRNRLKRGGGQHRVALSEGFHPSSECDLEIESLEEALELLGEVHPRRSQVIEMKYFGGMSTREMAEALNCSERTVERELRFGRAVLVDILAD